MKKLILPIILIISFLFFLPQKTYSQVGPECMKIFDKEMKDCTTDFNTCSDACMKKTEKPDGGAYINSGEIYPKCIKTSDCDGKSSACKEQSLANYRACGKSDKKPVEAKKEAPVQDKKGVNIFKIFELFTQAVMDLGKNKEAQSSSPQRESITEIPKQSGILSTQTVNDWIMENNLISDPARLEQMEREKLDLDLYGRTPQMTEEIVKKAREEWEAMFAKNGEESVVTVNGPGQLKPPLLDQFITVTAKDKPIYYTYFGEVVSVPKWAEIKFLKPVQDEKTQELKRMLKLNKGEVEIKVKNSNSKDKYGVQGDFFDLFVIQTHFWVNQSQDKRMAVIGVYEGEVEVKTKDGKTVKVKPDGGKPGVVVVSRKISPIKLAIAGGVLLAATGGIVWFVKRKKKK